MVKIKRYLVDSYVVEFDNESVKEQIKRNLLEKECGFDSCDGLSAKFHTNKVLKAIVNICMRDGINFEVEFF